MSSHTPRYAFDPGVPPLHAMEAPLRLTHTPPGPVAVLGLQARLMEVACYLPSFVGMDLGEPASVIWGAMWGASLDGYAHFRALAKAFRVTFPDPRLGLRSRLVGFTR